MSEFNASAVRQRYGRTPQSEDQILAYLKALKVVIGADGEIAPAEQAAFEKGMKHLGASQEVVDVITAFDHENGKLEDILGDLRKGGKRAKMLIYDCIHLSSADGVYAAEERAAVNQAASLLGIDKPTLHSLEALVDFERGVRRLRRGLFPKKK